MRFRDLPPEEQLRIREELAKILGVDVAQVPEEFDDEFLSRMGADSLDIVEIIMDIQDDDGNSPMPPFATA